jgi:hypothetical protein
MTRTAGYASSTSAAKTRKSHRCEYRAEEQSGRRPLWRHLERHARRAASALLLGSAALPTERRIENSQKSENNEEYRKRAIDDISNRSFGKLTDGSPKKSVDHETQ